MFGVVLAAHDMINWGWNILTLQTDYFVFGNLDRSNLMRVPSRTACSSCLHVRETEEIQSNNLLSCLLLPRQRFFVYPNSNPGERGAKKLLVSFL